MWDIATTKENSKIALFGYGENNIMGSFLIEGYFELVMIQNMQEKEGLKVDNNNDNQSSELPLFMKLKIAKFIF